MSKWDAMNPKKRRRMQDIKLSRYFRREIGPYHPYYRELAERLGINLFGIRSVYDLQKYPELVTSKDDIVGRDKDFVLQPTTRRIARHDPLKLLSGIVKARGSLATLRRELEMQYAPVVATLTTGRSSARTKFIFSNSDLTGFVGSGARHAFEMLELEFGPGDTGVSLFPVNVHLAHVFTVEGAKAVPALILPFSGLSTEQRIEAIEASQPKILFGVTSYVERLLTRAMREGKNYSSVARVVLGGEGVSDTQRARILEILHVMGSPDPVVVSSYGFTEARTAFIECAEGARQGMNVGYHIPPYLGLMEVVKILENPDGEIEYVLPCLNGEEGELLWTPLEGHGSVVLRWRTRDFARIDETPCPACGRKLPRVIGPIRRGSSDMLKNIKATLVDFNNVISLFAEDESVLVWQVVIDNHEGSDRLTVYLALVESEDSHIVEARLRNAFKIATEVSIDEFVVEPYEAVIERLGTDTELKELLIVDNRS